MVRPQYGSYLTQVSATEDADPRLGGSINERMIGESFNDEDYFIELTFETDYVEDWAHDVKD